MYPVNYPPMVPSGVMVERPPAVVTLEPSRSYLQPGESRRSPVLIQIRPCQPYNRPPSAPPMPPAPAAGIGLPSPVVPLGPYVDREAEDLVRMQEEFILSCQYPLRKLPEELLAEAKIPGYLHRHRKHDLSGSPQEGSRRKRRREFRSYSKSPGRPWRSQRRAERSKSRSPRRQTRAEYSPTGGKSPASQPETNNTLIRNK